jgi:hypothetical protein
MTRRTRLIVASSLLGSGLFLWLPPAQASLKAARADELQAPRWGDLKGETDIQAPRGASSPRQGAQDRMNAPQAPRTESSRQGDSEVPR